MIIQNEFHGTRARVNLTREEMHAIDWVIDHGFPGDPGRDQAIARRRRIWQNLCGIAGCGCSNAWGERPVPSREEEEK